MIYEINPKIFYRQSISCVVVWGKFPNKLPRKIGFSTGRITVIHLDAYSEDWIAFRILVEPDAQLGRIFLMVEYDNRVLYSDSFDLYAEILDNSFDSAKPMLPIGMEDIRHYCGTPHIERWADPVNDHRE